MSRCPDSARIAAYLDDRLFEEERRALEEHFAGCEGCWRVFADSVSCLAELRAAEEAAAPPARRRWLRARLAPLDRRWTAAALLLATVGLTGWLWQGRVGSGADARPESVVATAAEHRPVLPRLTGVVEWKAPPADRRRAVSADEPPPPGAWRYLKMVDEARAAAGDSPSGEQLQRLGAAYLLAGSADQGLQTLERATAAVPGDARALSDLGAAYLARGVSRGDANDVAEALETIDRALTTAPDLLEARFNRALALDELPLPGQAAGAWKAYLELDSQSAWAAEARGRLEKLARRAAATPSASQLRVEIVAAADEDTDPLEGLVSAHRQEAREAFGLDLLPAWGAAVVEGDEAEAAAHLAAAGRVAAEWQRQTDDHSLLRQVEEIERAGADRDGYARGHQALALGLQMLEGVQVEQAAAAFADAQRELPASSAARVWADLSALACEFYRGGPESTLLRQFEALVPRADGDEPLRAHLAWLRGLLHARRGELQTLARYQEALARFERLGESDHVLWLHMLLGDVRALYGDLTGAWRHRRQMLAALADLTHQQRRFGLLLGPATATAFLEGRAGVATALLDELSATPMRWDPRQGAELELWRSQVQLKLGQREQARAALRAANAWLWQVDDVAVRRGLAAELQAANGLSAETSTAAIASLSRSIDRVRSGAPNFRFPGLLLERARIYRQHGDPRRAAADLREGAAWLVRQSSPDPRQGLWLERLSGGDALFEELVALEVAAGRADRAFEVAEQARSRDPLAAAAQQTSAGVSSENRPSTLKALQQRLEPGTTVLYFCLLAKEALLWRVDSTGAALVRLEARPAELADWATQLRTDLAAGAWTPRTREVARRLHRALVTPARLGTEAHKLVVVAGGVLDQVPFTALVDPQTGRFLVEDRAVEMAPSAATFLAAQARARQLGRQRPSVLAVGDPRADEALFPGLTALPGAADEARQVAQLYSRRELLLGDRATPELLLARAGAYDVLHFAGHAVVNRVDPSRSSLALARRAGGTRPGALFAFELSSQRFASTRLVVLAGCGTGSGAESASAGTLSLARAFLVARVPSVVASLWPVVDGRTVELMTALHAGVSRGEEPAEALRAAQLTLLKAREPALRSPSTWAAFRILGS
ncbi:MAG TPA: CHAT domain-containing protein [Thermoanaerobaculia bacterium]|nr:CHAT domain-containing protein [Thermoanaerobaculia bacterium]